MEREDGKRREKKGDAATGRTAFTRQQIEANMHAMHEMLLAQTK